MLERAAPGARSSCSTRRTAPAEVWDAAPARSAGRDPRQEARRFYVIDAVKVARDAGMGGRINTVMQVCFFALSGVLPREEAIAEIKRAIEKTYRQARRRGDREELRRGRRSLAHLYEVPAPATVTGTRGRPPIVLRTGPRLREAGDRGDDRGEGRPAARERFPGGRHLAHGHGPVGEAQPGPRDPGLGREGLHPVQPVRHGLPARRHPGQGLCARVLEGRAGHVQVRRLSLEGDWSARSTRSRWPRRTARGAACAFTSARPRTRRIPATRPST